MENVLVRWLVGAVIVLAASVNVGCAGVEARSTVGGTQVHVNGYSARPEAAVREAGMFVQRATAAQTEQTLVLQGRMPFFPGGCFGSRCARFLMMGGGAGMGVGGVAPPLPTGRWAQGAQQQAAPASALPGDDTDGREAVARAQREAAEARAARDAALDALQAVVAEAEGQATAPAAEAQR